MNSREEEAEENKGKEEEGTKNIREGIEDSLHEAFPLSFPPTVTPPFLPFLPSLANPSSSTMRLPLLPLLLLSLPVVISALECSQYSSLSSSGESCSCVAGFGSTDCSKPVCGSNLFAGSGSGRAVATNGSVASCACDEGWGGPGCVGGSFRTSPRKPGHVGLWGDLGAEMRGDPLNLGRGDVPSRPTCILNGRLSLISKLELTIWSQKGGKRRSFPTKPPASLALLLVFSDIQLTLPFHFLLLAVCATGIACGVAYNASGYTPQTSSSLLSAGQVANNSMVCSGSPRVYTAGQMICDVVVSDICRYIDCDELRGNRPRISS